MQKNKETALNIQHLKNFCEHYYQALPEMIKTTFTKDHLYENIKQDISAEFENYNNPENAQEYYEHSKIPGTVSSDYENKLIEIDGINFLTGICFKGNNLNMPFVDIFGQDSPFTDQQSFQRAIKEILQRFHKFNVSTVRLTLFNNSIFFHK